MERFTAQDARNLRKFNHEYRNIILIIKRASVDSDHVFIYKPINFSVKKMLREDGFHVQSISNQKDGLHHRISW